jgi:hypothetical protein
MQSELAGLLNDAASLDRFVRFLRVFCDERRTSHRYVSSSLKFFDYVSKLAHPTGRFLQAVIRHPEVSPRDLQTRRLKLAILKRLWTILHELIKPAADAHTLRVPVPLLNLIDQQLRTIEGFSGSEVVTLLSPDLNYFQYQTGPLRDLTALVKSIVPAAPEFPTGFGFVYIPYSQGTSLFTNVLLYHEVGHFVFETLKHADRLLPKVNRALEEVLAADFQGAGEPERWWCRRHLLAWAEETYCDLFAVSLIGPAYSLASVELLNLLALLDEPDSLKFSKAHPADAYRFSEQLWHLKSIGWWQALGEARAEHQTRIETLASKGQETYLYREAVDEALGKRLIKAFLLVRDDVRALAQEGYPGLSPSACGFAEYNEAIQKYLLNATVPSTLNIGGERRHPPAQATINASFLFSLASVTELRKKIRDYEEDNVADHGEVTGRVELWAMKAIEDYALLNKPKEAG